MILPFLAQIFVYLLAGVLGILILRVIMNSGDKIFFRLEAYVYALLIGIVIIGFILFVVGLFGTLNLSITLSLLVLLGGALALMSRKKMPLSFRELPLSQFPLWKKWTLIFLAFFLSIKLGLGAVDIAMMPTYQDDTFMNWNMRGKVFYERSSLVLDKTDPDFLGRGYKQYPLTPSLLKTFIAQVSGGWYEGAVNFPSFVFFISTLVLIFFACYRLIEDPFFSFLGVYVASSIPIFFVHGTNPYFDIFQALYFLAAVNFAFLFLRKEIHVFPLALLIGLLGYTKSEGLIVYTTAVIAGLALVLSFQKRLFSEWRSLAWIVFFVIMINLPFILFKLFYGLGFGNGDASVTKTALTLHTEIFSPLYQALFHGGTYGLFCFFFVICGLLFFFTIGSKKVLFKKDDALYFSTGWIAFCIILFIYLTTFTYVYVLDQTGINRSMVQILPLFIVQFIVFLHSLTHAD